MIGGMGEIFLARQSGVGGFDRLVILKTLLPELAEAPGFIEQFLDEARVVATLNHPNIVNIYEVGEWDGLYVIAMEYIKGANLADLMSAIDHAGDKMPQRIAARIAMDAALALDHAHSAVDATGKPLNIVHRDVGLQNIMVRSDGVTKVVDFGIARASNRATRTRTGLIKGKLAYMSPEQVSSAELDGRSDEFSLGVVLWEMAAGQRLFRGDNELQTVQKLMNEPIPPPSSVEPSLDPELETIIMRMLARGKVARYPRCADAADALRRYLSATGTEVTEHDVAAVVEKYAGEKLAEATRDLTPSQETFASIVSPLRRAGSGSRSAVTITGSRVTRGRKAIPLTVLAVLLGAGGAVLATRQLGGRTRLTSVQSSAPLPAPAAGMALNISKPPGARVLVDGTEWPEKTPTVVRGLSMGPHEVQIKLPDRKALVKRVNLEVGKSIVIAEPPPASGMVLDIRDPAGAQVIIDGRPWKEAVPTVVTGLKPGVHEVRILEKDKPPVVRTVELAADTPVLIQPSPASEMPTLKLASNPEGASVRAGDRTLGITPLSVTSLEPNVVYDLVVSKAGYEAAQQPVTLRARDTKEMSVTLVRAEARPARGKRAEVGNPALPAEPKPNGFLTLNAAPWVKVSIDGQPSGSTPLYKVELAPGNHVLQLTNEEAGINVTRKVVVEPGQTAKLDLNLAK